MKTLKNFVILSFLIVGVFGFQNVDAQQNLAQEAYKIFENSCNGCHAQGGSYTEDLLLEYPTVIDDGSVIPGDPDNSEFYKRLITDDRIKRMPWGSDPLPEAQIETVRQWILSGAPDWNVVPDTDRIFITYDNIVDVIQNHLDDLSAFDRRYARYFTTTHLYNSGETTETLIEYQNALSKLVNSLSWGRNIVKPTPIDTANTIFYIDLRNYEWERGNNRWELIEDAYPYTLDFTTETDTGFLDKLKNLQSTMEVNVPFVHVDWFIAAASLPPLYNEILELPDTVRELEEKLDVDALDNLQNAPGRRVWRAGFNDSGVSQNNRVVERHTSRYGAYWKSYDFAGNEGVQNIFTYPLSFREDGGEIIFNLPNGLQAYHLIDAAGKRLDAAPTEIVSNPAADDPVVRNGLSCFGCHTEGMKTITDTVRSDIESNPNPSYDKEYALSLYVKKEIMDQLVAKDAEQYRVALVAAVGTVEDIDPIHFYHDRFKEEVSLAHAAATVGLQTEEFRQDILGSQTLINLGLLTLTTDEGKIKRDVWTAGFTDVLSVIYDGVERDDQPDGHIPGPNVFIPDPNLRTVVEEILNKTPGATITYEDMAKLNVIEADEREISDLRGLEYATNLVRIEFRRNQISDLSPLRNLTKLNNIKLRGNQITDVTPLANLKNVDWLGLEQNQITDLTPLQNLKKLTGIGITANPIEDISPLSTLTSLERIDAWRSPIKDFSSLKTLKKLNWLEYGNDRNIDEMPNLEGLTSLTRLEIHGCSYKNNDFSQLSQMKQLEWLELVNNGISNLEPLKGLTNLTVLNLDANAIFNVEPLKDLTNLEVLYLENNAIQDVTQLSGLKNLERLDLRNNAITDFSPVSVLTSTFVRMDGNPGFPTGGDKITGPWLWTIVPGTRIESGTDFLARATGGIATEIKIATDGATAGKPVGKSKWVWHNLSSTGGDNINQMTEALGWGRDEEVYDHIVYGSTILESPIEQETTMFIGSSDAVKVWLNGEVIHEAYVNRGSNDFQDVVSDITLKQGRNVLLVALDNHGHGTFSAFFGFKPGTQYSVFRPNTRFTFNTDSTDLTIGDTFTLHLNVENIQKLSGWQADLVFNPDVLQVVPDSQVEGDFLITTGTGDQTSPLFPQFQPGTINNEEGKIENILVLNLSDTVSGKGTLYSVDFEVVGLGECLLTLENFEATTLRREIPVIAPILFINLTHDADVNGDGEVDIRDLILVAQSFGDEATSNPDADLNGDGYITVRDMIIVAQTFGESTSAAPHLVVMDSVKLTPVMVQAWIEQAQLEDDGSNIFKQGITNLEKLLETITVPKKTMLLANYPNPFNPETWIPYQLSESAEVVLHIYAADGQQVRKLKLGHQPAGIYQSRNRAAFWDGKNETGESVASGIYFYMFTTGKFTATRRMLLVK